MVGIFRVVSSVKSENGGSEEVFGIWAGFFGGIFDNCFNGLVTSLEIRCLSFGCCCSCAQRNSIVFDNLLML